MVELAEDEIWNLGKVWVSVLASLTYSYFVGKIIPQGFTRLVAILPVISLFLLLPLILTSIILCGTTAFFISWLSNFKLLLFAFGKPPLGLNPPIAFFHFIVVSSLPIVVQSEIKSHNSPGNVEKNAPIFSIWDYIIKAAILVILSWILFDYQFNIGQNVLWIVYFIIIYLYLEVILACVASFARIFLGLELEPHFKDPLSCTSSQDFWGKRWNLMATDILRPTVYQPSLVCFSKIISHKNAKYPAVMTTFMVSAVLHELIFYYLGHMRPTFEVTLFFLTNGVFVCFEIAAKKHFTGKLDVPRWISSLVTLSFVLVSGFWLFLPPLLRIGLDSKMLQEYAAICSFLRSMRQALW